MTRLVAFLRAINVGGHTVRMEDLRDLFRGLGLRDVESFIASGNLIFTSGPRAIPALERRIEARLGSALGYRVDTFIRSEPEVADIACYQPFPKSRIRTAGALCVGFLGEPLTATGRKSLMALLTDIDDFHVHGREVYWLCQKRQGESTFSNVILEKAVRSRSTFRGMNTIVRLATRYGFSPSGKGR